MHREKRQENGDLRRDRKMEDRGVDEREKLEIARRELGTRRQERRRAD